MLLLVLPVLLAAGPIGHSPGVHCTARGMPSAGCGRCGKPGKPAARQLLPGYLAAMHRQAQELGDLPAGM